jgi:quinoprotein dehydrogenase-associated probable ABC transporter substrate-binding protein
MYSLCRDVSARASDWIGLARLARTLALVLLLPVVAWADETRVLRVAADPNNLPFSNERGEGFENRLVELIARELGARIEYTWRAQRRGFFRETMKEGNCDLVAGVPRGFDPVLTTAPYYRSGYVLVQRASRDPRISSLDDPRLKSLTVGVQMIGDDFANTPPAHALSRRGLVQNVRGYSVYGDYREPNPPARIMDGVIRGEVDVACVWGPLAGYFAREHQDVLILSPLPPFDPVSEQPFAFEIAMGVRKGNRALRDELNTILARKKADIERILDEFGVPRIAAEAK